MPEGAVAVLSAHGVAADGVRRGRAARGLELIDATCPLVTKVHVEARRFADDERTIVLIGHAGHEEVEGTSGQAPERTVLVQTAAEARDGRAPDGPAARLPDADHAVGRRDRRDRPAPSRSDTRHLEGPPREDICYATQNRQDAVKELVAAVDVLLVIGSKNSSNSNRLAEVARERGKPGYLVDDETEVDPAWLEGASVVGLTSGASAPEHLVERMLAWLAARGFDDVEQVSVAEEGVRFSLPAGVRPSPMG